MSELDRERVTELVGEALGLRGEERSEWLDEACGDDHALRAEVDSLLREEGALEEGFLESPAATALIGRVLDPANKLPEAVGPYRILRVLGRGGMGTVYLAEQKEPVERLVALKVLNRVAETVGPRSRFAAECRALARLKHSNVATIFDAGISESERAFVAMEWVEGADIATWCDHRRASVDERIQIFKGVCAGVSHAHEKGLIHQDLKPANVLVAESGGIAEAKVIDFGIARLLDESSHPADASAWVAGSPRYMSPEAADLRGGDVDTRSDVFSLGVLLFELLVGQAPHDLSGLPLKAQLRSIRDETAPTLSQRWARIDSEAQAELAALRGTSSAALARRWRGDLDAVLEKALALDREQRYASPAALADDLDRHLQGLPVTARAPTVAYRVSSFMRRHAAAVGGVMIVILLLSASLVARTLEAERANREAERARRALAESSEVSDFLISLFSLADPDRTPDQPVSVDGLLDRAETSLETRLVDQPVVKARFLRTIGSIAMNLGQLDRAEKLHVEALALRERHGDVPDSAGWSREVEIAASSSQLGVVLRRQGRLDEAEPHLDRAVDLLEEAGDPGQLSAALSHRANLYWRQDRFDKAIAGHQRALAIRRQDLPDDLGAIAESLTNLGVALRFSGRQGEAAPALREASELLATTLGDEHPRTAVTWLNLGGLEEELGRWHEAEALFEKSWASLRSHHGPAHPRTVLAHRALGTLCLRWYRYGEAADLFRDLLTAQEEADPSSIDPLSIAHTLNSLGATLKELEDFDGAETVLRRALDIRVEHLGPDHLMTAKSRAELAGVDWQRGEPDVAEPHYRRWVELIEEKLGPRHIRTGQVLNLHGRVLLDQGRVDEAEAALRRALAIREAHSTIPSLALSLNLFQLGELLQRHGAEREGDEGEGAEREGVEGEGKALMDRALAMQREILPQDHPLLKNEG